jgi:hypothetical protein
MFFFTGTVSAQIKDWLMNPRCGLVVQIVEDKFTKKLRLARPDAQRIDSGLHRDYHELFGDHEFAYFVKHLLQLWRYSLGVFDSPMPMAEILDVSGEQIFEELKEAHDHLRFLTHLLRPPRLARRKGEWWTWEQVSAFLTVCSPSLLSFSFLC